MNFAIILENNIISILTWTWLIKLPCNCFIFEKLHTPVIIWTITVLCQPWWPSLGEPSPPSLPLLPAQNSVGKSALDYRMERFFISLALTSAIFYASDTCSDVHLGVRCLRNRDHWWASATFVCVFIPWITNLVTHASYWKRIRRSKPALDPFNLVVLVAAVLNFHPSTTLLCAAWFRWKGMNITAKKLKDNVTTLRFVEVVFEAFPQSVLQIYIVGQTNHFDYILIFSIATSLWSVSSGIFQASFQAVERVSKFHTNDGILQRRHQLIEALLFTHNTPNRAAITRPPAESIFSRNSHITEGILVCNFPLNV